MIDNVVKAMETCRRELIAQPLNRIWPELARAAIEAMREPTDAMVTDGEGADDGMTHPDTVRDIYQAMINAALTA